MSTQNVLDHHLKCFGEGDLDGILDDYASDAVLFVPEATLHGHDEIKAVFVGMFAEFAKPGMSFEMKHMSVDGDYAFIMWTAETADNSYPVGTDTFVVRDGKIVAQSFAAHIIPKG
jgi:ketosteroid isomerase-like protein